MALRSQHLFCHLVLYNSFYALITQENIWGIILRVGWSDLCWFCKRAAGRSDTQVGTAPHVSPFSAQQTVVIHGHIGFKGEHCRIVMRCFGCVQTVTALLAKCCMWVVHLTAHEFVCGKAHPLAFSLLWNLYITKTTSWTPEPHDPDTSTPRFPKCVLKSSKCFLSLPWLESPGVSTQSQPEIIGIEYSKLYQHNQFS